MDRGDVHDAPGDTGGDHPPRGGAGGQERARQVDVEHPPPGVRRQLSDRGHVDDPGAVDEHAGRAEGAFGPVERARQLAFVADVAADRQGFPTAVANRRRCQPGRLGVHVDDPDSATAGRQLQRARPADTGPGPGHHGQAGPVDGLSRLRRLSRLSRSGATHQVNTTLASTTAMTFPRAMTGFTSTAATSGSATRREMAAIVVASAP